MSARVNEYNQPIGQDLSGWIPAAHPEQEVFTGKFCCLERLNVERHAEELYEAFQASSDNSNWTYLPYGPFSTYEEYREFLLGMEGLKDPFHYTVIDQSTKKAVGTISLMRVDTMNGVIEIGHVVYSPRMQRTPISTEVMALLLSYIFDKLGYRRLEWKCDSLNGPSRAAAERFGFKFEGVFRQLQVTQRRNRDTAWYSIIDSEYAVFKSAYDTWLDSNNFDESGYQLSKLGKMITALR
ncbi:GNAT family N-acetyltransferase [Pokkaliibacter plantistimulans]|uniref:GNAT family N-acetyltransferase n=1 Tax=Proteobacteria bacterium 228 TaxID=2083153 RepID=A0A2S5KSD6_9PROT|nr:GNAT family protein [Pokkaliibacter plantistimulans]PPC77575.1 GNAT family N-acetyltransferase [Pokkaliibacter plantistimulans]